MFDISFFEPLLILSHSNLIRIVIPLLLNSLFIISMIIPKDEQMEALLGQQTIKPLKIKCDSGNLIERFCSNKNCPYDALCCNEQTCKICEQQHSNCILGEIKRLTKKLQERLFFQKKILRKAFEIENELINKLSSSRIRMIKNINFWKLKGQPSSIVESIYFDGKIKGIKGKQMKNLFTILSQTIEESKVQNIINKFRMQGETILEELNQIRQALLVNSFEGNYSDDFKGKITYINSKILTNSVEDKKKLGFLLKQLRNPSQLRLLFRASENNFSAKKFHTACNNIGDTVTIVRTEFNKTIAGYTPIKWSQIEGYQQDPSKKSCLLQLDQCEIMKITDPKCAIYNCRTHGPIFGNNHDLWIADNCYEFKYSGSKFPSSYNNGTYAQGQQSLQSFCGTKSGNNFRVLEYQVYQVIR